MGFSTRNVENLSDTQVWPETLKRYSNVGIPKTQKGLPVRVARARNTWGCFGRIPPKLTERTKLTGARNRLCARQRSCPPRLTHQRRARPQVLRCAPCLHRTLKDPLPSIEMRNVRKTVRMPRDDVARSRAAPEPRVRRLGSRSPAPLRRHARLQVVRCAPWPGLDSRRWQSVHADLLDHVGKRHIERGRVARRPG